MKAVVLKQYGGAEALAFVDRADPLAGPDQVVVRQHATTFNPFDMKLASGVLKAAIPLECPFVPGGDVSGVIEAVGEGVEDLRVGDAVFGYSAPGGAYAEQIAVAADAVTRKPASLDFADTAALALVGQTAAQALDATGVGAGDTLVVIGAGGSVGSVIVQLASDAGIDVVAIAEGRDAERLQQIGATATLNRGYTAADAPTDANAVIDAVGGEGQLAALAMLREGGILVALNQPPSQEEAERRGVRATLVRTATTKASLDTLRERIEGGTVRPFIGKRYTLADAAQAWRDAAAGATSGKLVLIADA